MIKQNANVANGKAAWEMPQLVTVDANLADVEANINLGTDGLINTGSSAS